MQVITTKDVPYLKENILNFILLQSNENLGEFSLKYTFFKVSLVAKFSLVATSL